MSGQSKVKTLSFFCAACSLLSAALFYFSYPNYFNPYGFSGLAWISLVPLFFSFYQQSYKCRLLYVCLYSFVSYSGIVFWLKPVSFLGYICFVLALSVQPVIFSLFFDSRHIKSFWSIIFISSLWVVSEYVRSIVLGGFSWTLGHSQSFLPWVIQLADIGGAYLISFIIVSINMALFVCFINPKQRKNIFLFVIMCALCIYFYGHERNASNQSTGNEKFSICSVQANISSKDKLDPAFLDDIVDKHISLSYRCLEHGIPHLIIWPEISVPDDVIRDDVIYKKIKHLVENVPSNFLIGSALLIDGKDYNSAVLFDEQASVRSVYHKKYLIPFSEYYPLKNLFKSQLYHNRFEFRSGKDLGIMQFPFQNVIFGTLICSEDNYPRLIRQILKQEENVGFFSVLLNDGWFLQKTGLMMHLQNAIMQAVTFKRPFIRSSNSGVTAYINERGVMNGTSEKDLKIQEERVFHYNIIPKKGKTFYTQFGDIFSLLCLVFVIIWAKRMKYNP